VRPPSGLGLACCGGRWRIGGGSTTGGQGRAFRAMLPLPVLSRRLLTSSLSGLLFGRGDPIIPDAGPAHRTILTKYKGQGGAVGVEVALHVVYIQIYKTHQMPKCQKPFHNSIHKANDFSTRNHPYSDYILVNG